MPYTPSSNPSRNLASDLSSPATRVVEITPSSSDLPEYVRAVRCDIGGTLAFIPLHNADNAPVTWNVASGELVQVQIRRVLVDSTASGIHGLI